MIMMKTREQVSVFTLFYFGAVYLMLICIIDLRRGFYICGFLYLIPFALAIALTFGIATVSYFILSYKDCWFNFPEYSVIFCNSSKIHSVSGTSLIIRFTYMVSTFVWTDFVSIYSNIT